MVNPEDILAFWLEEVGPKGWYGGGDQLDAEICKRFQATWEAAQVGASAHWLSDPRGALAYIILMDQFPRNMFRGTGQAFSSDAAALEAAKSAIRHGWDLRVDEPERQFYYMPLMHSECLVDQDRCVRLMLTRMPKTGAGNLQHARAHREVIRRFGRFPTRNEALDRMTTAPEAAFVADGGYRKALEDVGNSAA